MGLYTEITYKEYTPAYHENLFYSHFLGLPLFLPWHKSLRSQFLRLHKSAPWLTFRSPISRLLSSSTRDAITLSRILTSYRKQHVGVRFVIIPSQIRNLALNALTQFVCISGVNMLASRTSALGVSIVLNLRKLVSLILSICIFGTSLPMGVVAGAVLVFGSAGLWGWEGQRQKRTQSRQPSKKDEGGSKER